MIKILRFIGWTGLVCLAAIVLFYKGVGLYSKNKLYNDPHLLPQNEAALVLGTSKYIIINGKRQNNLYYRNRLKAVSELYHLGKVKAIIVSGDNSTKYYNEPKAMLRDLQALGVKKEAITIDNFGVRTYDSVLRAKMVFGYQSITIVSQKFHNERAICISKIKGIDAVAYNAKNVPQSYGPKVYIRELFARVKMLIDLAMNAQPSRWDNEP